MKSSGVPADVGPPEKGNPPAEKIDGRDDPRSHPLRTAEVLARTGISHQVLYRYVTLGLVEPIDAGSTGQRSFHPSVVALIEVIQELTRSGYALRDLKDIFFKDERVRRATERPV